MNTNGSLIGTVVSDQETPTFETVRIKLKADHDVMSGTLVRIPVSRNSSNSTLIGRIRSAHEHNPNEQPGSINVRDTLGISRNYPAEADSTVIYRQVEADLIEEFVGEITRAPQSLPNSGADVFLACEDEIVRSLGLTGDKNLGLHIGTTISGSATPIILKREAIQRHLFICGTTGNGKSELRP
jgi:hypothetical protein